MVVSLDGKGLENKVLSFIRRFGFPADGDRVLVAVSGGADSTALLVILHDLAEEKGLEIVVAHYNHCLRGEESHQDEAFVRRLCQSLGVDAVVGYPPSGGILKVSGESLQEGARRLRYDFFLKVAKEVDAQLLALGHHQSDQAETVLMRFIDGAGPRGLSGIPPIGQWKGLQLIRPLMMASREEILEYLAGVGQQYRADSSNTSLGYRRNRIRLDLLPDLKTEYNPAIEDALVNTAEIMRAVDDLLCSLTEELAQEVLSRDGQAYIVDINGLASRPLALQRRLMRRAYKMVAGDAKDLSFQHTEAMVSLLRADTGKRISLPGPVTAVREYKVVRIGKHETEEASHTDGVPAARKESEGRLDVPGVVHWDNRRCLKATSVLCTGEVWADAINSNRCVAYIDADAVEFPLRVRTRLDGDDFTPLGMTGTKKLKDFFVDEKVPARERDQIPLVVDAANRILWVAGMRLDDSFKLTQSTRTAVRLELITEAQ